MKIFHLRANYHGSTRLHPVNDKGFIVIAKDVGNARNLAMDIVLHHYGPISTWAISTCTLIGDAAPNETTQRVVTADF